MRYEQLHVGDVRVSAILDHEGSEGPIVGSFPDVRAEDLLAERQRYPGVYGPGETWILRVRAWAVEHPGGVLLVDTGVGGASSPAMGWARSPGALVPTLEGLGIAPADVDTVVLSHVHDDHIGGTVDDDGNPRFPRARHLIQRSDLEWQRRLAAEDEAGEEHRPIWERLLAPIEAAGMFDPVDGDHRIDDRLALRHAPGHTPGHQILVVMDGRRRLLVSADAFNHPSQLSHPEWPSGPDTDHRDAERTRRILIAELRDRPDTVLAPTHFDRSFGRLDVVAADPTWAPLDTA